MLGALLGSAPNILGEREKYCPGLVSGLELGFGLGDINKYNKKLGIFN